MWILSKRSYLMADFEFLVTFNFFEHTVYIKALILPSTILRALASFLLRSRWVPGQVQNVCLINFDLFDFVKYQRFTDFVRLCKHLLLRLLLGFS